jgi:3-methyladenine DNA glycosylase AlkD
MRRYMKSEMPFLGVSRPALKAVLQPVLNEFRLTFFEEWRDTVLKLWRRGEFREERYAAIQLSGHRYYRKFQTFEALPMYEAIIASGAWWDYVDEISSGRLYPLLQSFPDEMTVEMRTWSQASDRWKRRASIICQLPAKDHTDLGLLYACIEANLGDRDFFIRKAIGWALRQYARSDPAEVARYVAAKGDALSPLSRREALKNIG